MTRFLISLAGLFVILGPNSLMAQNSYTQSNLVANVAGVATNTDPQLSNPWGVAFKPGGPFWIADNNSGFATVYDAAGNKDSLVVTIPVATYNSCNAGCPSGIVANSGNAFGGASFLFDTEDGIVASWSSGANANTVFDNSLSGAVYKGLAIDTNSSGTFLLAANLNSGGIDVLDTNFNMTALPGSFTDPSLPAGLVPHGIHVINNQVYVAYALADSARQNAVPSAGTGVIDIFDLNGNFVRTLTSGGTLNAPWGVMMAPATFGAFANDILVGNFGDGTINAFDPTSGSFQGQLTDSTGAVIVNPGLWDMVVGQGGTGDPNTMYLTAGGSDQAHGLFAALTPTVAAGSPDFSLSVSQPTLTVPIGGSGSVTISAAALSGFNGSVSLSCSGLPATLSCTFSPASIAAGATSTLTVSVASTYTSGKMQLGMLLPFAWGLLGFVAVGKRNPLSGLRRHCRCILGLLVLSLALMLMTACAGVAGSTTHASTSSSGSTTTIMVTGTSGGLSHSIPVSLTIM
jgi:uncharacterized protein (TIGR03118 family)